MSSRDRSIPRSNGCRMPAGAKWGKSPTGRRARYYTITASGRKQLGQEISAFDSITVAIARVLGRVEEG